MLAAGRDIVTALREVADGEGPHVVIEASLRRLAYGKARGEIVVGPAG